MTVLNQAIQRPTPKRQPQFPRVRFGTHHQLPTLLFTISRRATTAGLIAQSLNAFSFEGIKPVINRVWLAAKSFGNRITTLALVGSFNGLRPFHKSEFFRS